MKEAFEEAAPVILNRGCMSQGLLHRSGQLRAEAEWLRKLREECGISGFLQCGANVGSGKKDGKF
jgi:hypothetical protein